MKKKQLTKELISNAITFYSNNFENIFSDKETENLSGKLLNIVKYDCI